MNLLEVSSIIKATQQLIKLISIKLTCIDLVLWAGHYDRCWEDRKQSHTPFLKEVTVKERRKNRKSVIRPCPVLESREGMAVAICECFQRK